MKKTLYEILEVSEKASKEVIEKAYKVLAKKYHPDLQTEENKAKAENKMKETNEAYNVLSDDTAREKYDEELASIRENERQEELRNSREEAYSNVNMQNEVNIQYENQNTINEKEINKKIQENLRKQQEMYAKQQAGLEKQYNNAYYKYLRSLGYKIKFKWTWKQYVTLFIIIAVLIIIGLILWAIPPTHDWMLDLYNNNVIVKIVANIFIGIFNGIGKVFSNIFSK